MCIRDRSYRAPSNLRDQNDDHISNEDRIGNENDLNDVRNVGGDDHIGDDHIGDDHIGGDDLRAEDRSSDNNNDEDTINADSRMESVTNSLRRQGAIPKTVERGSVNRVTSQNGDENTHGLSPPKRSERYSPVTVSYTHLDVYKRQVIKGYINHKDRISKFRKLINATHSQNIPQRDGTGEKCTTVCKV